MKKNLLLLAALICGFLTFSSCGNDDEPSVIATVSYSLNCNELTKASNVIVYYVGDNGEIKFEALTPGASTWTKKITTNRFPATLGFQLAISTKEQSELTQENYNVQTEAGISIQLSSGASYNNHSTLIAGGQVKQDKVLDLLKKNNGVGYGYVITRDGSASSTKISLK